MHIYIYIYNTHVYTNPSWVSSASHVRRGVSPNSSNRRILVGRTLVGRLGVGRSVCDTRGEPLV